MENQLPSESHSSRTAIYLALGDSMSIDEYTGVKGGGAVSQFYRRLGPGWTLVDRTFDGCILDEVPRNLNGDLITLTVGGNDAITHLDHVRMEGVSFLVRQHLRLLVSIKRENRDCCLIVGNIYSPQTPLPQDLVGLLDQLNEGIGRNVREVGGCLADIRSAFAGKESTYLCQEIEPTLEGATAIAGLFAEQFSCWQASRSR